jgi:hybrid polyketide synthase / nonribosomal peptide synthetase ACE1
VATAAVIPTLVHAATMKDGVALGLQDTTIVDVSSLPKATAVSVPNSAQSQDAAAIIYTSGSTGVPKGIILKHSGLLNELEGTATNLELVPQVVLQQSALSFDMSIWQASMGLANGGTVHVIPYSARRDPIALTKLIATEQITLTGATPSEYLSWLRYGTSMGASNWKIAVSGGEAMTQSLKQECQALSKPNLRLFNFYGPTELSFSCHAIKMFYDRTSDNAERIPAGFTSRNCSTYIVDEDVKLVPAGFPGEVLVGGAGVALVYKCP